MTDDDIDDIGNRELVDGCAHHRQLLAETLNRILVSAGVVEPVMLNGPELLMHGDDFARALTDGTLMIVAVEPGVE